MNNFIIQCRECKGIYDCPYVSYYGDVWVKEHCPHCGARHNHPLRPGYDVIRRDDIGIRGLCGTPSTDQSTAGQPTARSGLWL